MAEQDKDIGRLEGSIDLIKVSLAKIEKVLIVGNGVPSMVDRMARVEETIERISGLVESNSKHSEESINQLQKSISELKEIVSTHAKDDKKHTPLGILFRREVIFYGVAVFLFLHAIIPANLNIWDLFTKLLGL